jgi:hypothetical protein
VDHPPNVPAGSLPRLFPLPQGAHTPGELKQPRTGLAGRTACGNLGVVNDDESTAAPEYENGWRWQDPRWQEWTGNEPVNLLLEAVRRAVDIRDRTAARTNLSARAVILVDVLNALCKSLQVDDSDIWNGSDLWNDPEFGEGYDEGAFWKARSEGREKRT